jgi:uncharacterized cupin superfamily protein
LFKASNEESLFILEDAGSLRRSGETRQVKSADIICCPIKTEHPHEIVNSGRAATLFADISIPIQ